MNHPNVHGSATILPFRPRSAGSRPSGDRIFVGRPADVALLSAPQAIAAASLPIVDIDGWYHAEAMDDVEPGKH